MALRFTQRDFLGLREEMVRFMQEKLGDKWNDYSESDETITLIELLAHCVSNLHFAYDNQKRESDIVTAAFPRNIYAQAIRNGYKPSLFKAGKTWLNIDLRKKIDGTVIDEFTTLPVSVIIPRYTQIKNNDGDICVTNREFILPAGTSHFSIEVLSGEYAFEQFTRNDINDFNYVVLNRLNIAYGTTRLLYQKEAWTPVVDVFTDPRTNKIYSLEPNFVQNGVRNIIRFFSTWKDEIIDNSTIILEYIQTFGANSNYEKDTFTSYLNLNDLSNNTVSFDDDIFDSSGLNIKTWKDVDFSFSQPKEFVNGQNFESVDVIKKSYIQSLRQSNALVVIDDYSAFLTLSGLNEFYVTDWNKNSSDLITLEYPKDIKALKAEPDSDGHTIFSTKNTTTTPYWPNDVSYINSVDNITETRKINGREIIIYKSFDVNINNFKQFEGEHWYDEWVSDSKILQKDSSFTELTPSIYLASPDTINENLNINYNDELCFIDFQSRLLHIIKDTFTSEQQEKKLRLFVYNQTDGLLCAKFEDLYDLSIRGYNCSPQFCSKIYDSYYKYNEITTLPLDPPPTYFDVTEFVQTDVADVIFDSKNKIYTDEFKQLLSDCYGDEYENLKSKESYIKNSIRNKINSISIQIDGIDSEFIVPSALWYDTFVIIDGSSKTKDTNNNEEYSFKHALYNTPDVVYQTIDSKDYINDFIVDPHENDKYGLPIINLYSSKEEKTEAVDSGDLDLTNPIKLYSTIGLCFRKKTIDLLNPMDFISQENDNVFILTETQSNTNEKTTIYKSNDNNVIIQKSISNTIDNTDIINTVYIPVTSKLIEKNYTSVYKLKNIQPTYFLNDNQDDFIYEENNQKVNGYKAIEYNNTTKKPVVVINDAFYHDDFFFDKEQLTVKPLNIHYYSELLNQQNISGITEDLTSIVYVEEHVVNKCNDYSLIPSGVTIDEYQEYFDSKFGFIRTAQSVSGIHKYDYKTKNNNVKNGIQPLLNLTSRLDYIYNSFLLYIQTSYPKYLKFLILRVCLDYEAQYFMSHKQLNERLVNIGIDNIIYALKKIMSAKVSVNYWYTDVDATLGKQYTYSANENKRFLCCGGTTSWDENNSPSKNYFRWNVVFPEIVDLYQNIQYKQGRGDSVIILPYKRSGIDVHAHIFIDSSTADVASVFENIWNSLIGWFGLLKNIEEVKYISELISVIQSADVNILKICTVNEVPYNGEYIVQQPLSDENIFITDTRESSVKDFYRFLKFEPKTDIKQNTDLGQAIVLGNVCIRLQKMSSIEKTVYHFERSCFKIETTLAYKLKQLN